MKYMIQPSVQIQAEGFLYCKDTPQKAALREMMGNYLKENNVNGKDEIDVNSIMRDMMFFFKLVQHQSDHP